MLRGSEGTEKGHEIGVARDTSCGDTTPCAADFNGCPAIDAGNEIASFVHIPVCAKRSHAHWASSGASRPGASMPKRLDNMESLAGNSCRWLAVREPLRESQDRVK